MTVIANAGLVLKDSQGNKGIVKSFTDNDIDKISNAITDVGQVVDPATHMPIEATKTSAGVVQLATAQDITNGTAGKVVDAQELNNFAQTLPSVNGVTDVSSGDNSNQIVVSKFGGNKTLTIDNVEHADNADEATHASQADTATSANSVAWDNVSGKPSSYTPSSHTHDDRYYTESEIDTKLGGKANSSHTHDDRYYTESEIDTKLSGKSDTTHNHNSAYLGITAKAESAKSADSVAWSNVSSRPTKVSQFTNDSGYITSSGTAATISQKVDSSAKTHTNYNTNGTYVPTMNFLSYWNGAYASSGASNLTYCAQGTIIGSNNIGSQSVNYANSAGAVAWSNVSGKPSSFTPSSHTHDDRYYTESEIDTKLSSKVSRLDGGYKSIGGNGEYFWCKLATITINSGYINNPIFFEIDGRGILRSIVQIVFGSTADTDPALVSFTSDISTEFYIKKVATSKWELYGNYSEAWGSFCLYRVACNMGTAGAVTIDTTFSNLSSSPSGTTRVSVRSSSSVAWSNVSGRPDIWIG